MKFSRRTLLQTTTAAAVSSSLVAVGCSPTDTETATKAVKGVGDKAALSSLDKAKDLMLRAYPETASSVGITEGDYAALKSQLTDRTIAGQAKIAGNVKSLLKELQAIDTDQLTPEVALDVDVVTSVFDRAAEGFDYPYGDVALLNYNWSYRNSPYVVAQNTGAFVEIPSFLDSSHAIESAADADAYLERMKAYAAQLDGEIERVKADGARGVILPDFLLEKTVAQLQGARDRTPAEWGLVQSVVNRGKAFGDYEDKAVSIAAQDVVPALTRQIEALGQFRCGCVGQTRWRRVL